MIPVPKNPNFEAELKQQTAAIAKRRALLDAINRFVRGHGAWLVSAPGDVLRIEAKPDSEVPDLLSDRGFALQALGTGSRIEGGVIRPVCIYNLRIPLPRK